jgi:hypothetical protein
MLFNSTGVVKKLVDYLDRLCVEFLALWRSCLKLRGKDARKHEWIASGLDGPDAGRGARRAAWPEPPPAPFSSPQNAISHSGFKTWKFEI